MYKVQVSWLKNTVLALVLFFISMQKGFAQTTVIISIPFKLNSYVIEAKWNVELDMLVAKCCDNNNFYIKMFGFADTTGTETYNDTLSQKRVDAVYNYLKEKIALNDKNCYRDSEGESGEIYDLHFPEAHVQQRFVDLKVLFRVKK
jgi:OOP family OmpA-OmpF porin